LAHCGDVPIFYFNVFNSITVIDEEGQRLPDLSTAEEVARQAAGELIGEAVTEGRKINAEHRIEVEDEQRHQVHVLRFGTLFDRPVIDDPAHMAAQAARCRRLAAHCDNAEVRRSLLELAVEFDQRVETAD
jgi:hypothetical protein